MVSRVYLHFKRGIIGVLGLAATSNLSISMADEAMLDASEVMIEYGKGRKSTVPDLTSQKRKADRDNEAEENQLAIPKRVTRGAASLSKAENVLPVSVIKGHLEEKIIGEDNATNALAIYVNRHYKAALVNQQLQREGSSQEIRKLNILLVGPTGCGKTASILALTELFDVPYFIGDASSFSRTGYVGESVSSVIAGLLKAAKYNVKLAEKGIVFIDELDKAAAMGEKHGRDVGGADVQAELLKLMEGKKIKVEVKNEGQPDKEYEVDTKGILFIGGGAFTGLAPKKPGESHGPHDFVDIGFKPELLGRFGKTIFFEGVSQDKMLKILQSPIASPIQENLVLLERGYGIHLNFTEEALQLIAQKAYEAKTGVRGLINMVGAMTEPLLAKNEDYADKTITIDRAFIESHMPAPKTEAKYEPWRNMFS